jgi:hypothetical protein
MAPRPTCERPPAGINAYWSRTFDHAVRVLKEQGTWADESKALLDEYVLALVAAERCRDGWVWMEALDESAPREWSESTVVELARAMQSLSTQWDRHVKRAMALADQLALTPRGRKAAGVGEPKDVAPDSFAGLDELAARRGA